MASRTMMVTTTSTTIRACTTSRSIIGRAATTTTKGPITKDTKKNTKTKVLKNRIRIAAKARSSIRLRMASLIRSNTSDRTLDTIGRTIGKVSHSTSRPSNLLLVFKVALFGFDGHWISLEDFFAFFNVASMYSLQKH